MTTLKWISFPDPKLVLNGLPWFAENSPEVWRLPGRLKDVVYPAVWELATNPSGGRIRFASDTTAFAVRLQYDSVNKDANNMCPIGHSGVALYADGQFLAPAWPVAPGLTEKVIFEDVKKARRELTLYLPNYHDVKVIAIGVSPDAGVSAPAPFAVAKPVAFYGSSITQGGCASQAGLSYEAILGRMLNVDFVNLGFSGEGRGEPPMAKAFADIDASCFVVDFAQNCRTCHEMRSSYVPFVMTIRGRHPNVPIVCVTPIFSTWETLGGGTYERHREMRQIVRDAVATRKAAGDAHLTLVEGTDLIRPDEGDSFVDGVHPNDLGFQRMAERLAPTVAKVLGLGSECKPSRKARDREIKGEF
jgi:hypothetical protein